MTIWQIAYNHPLYFDLAQISPSPSFFLPYRIYTITDRTGMPYAMRNTIAKTQSLLMQTPTGIPRGELGLSDHRTQDYVLQ